ncbi:uncharacterized protein LOC114316702 [Camellia sinensis]|uniref:uncharacterized protein LOC114316702 n=1 Tax=Camellia sinensis TaxID=4442 RepID=UPI001035EA5E|nr:uncharacterized protein LOC114316702 [Camellia sinensis]
MEHYLTVRKWEPDFKASEAFETTTTIWVRFSELPLEYFQEKVLYAIAKQIGKPLKIDLTTAMATRGRFARVCIEMDLRKPLFPRFLLGKKSYNIEYESIHSFCFFCGRIDHQKEFCKYQAANPKPQETHRSTPPSEESQLAVSNHKDQATANSNKKNSNLQSTKTADVTYGPWMMVTKRTRKPTIHRKAQSTRPSSNTNRFTELGKDIQQEEDKARGKKTTRLGLEKEAPSLSIPTPVGPSKTTAQPPQDSTHPSSPSQPYQLSPQENTANGEDTLSQVPCSHQTSDLMHANPSSLGINTKSPEISMVDLHEKAPLSHTPNPPPPDIIIASSDGSSTTKQRKPPDLRSNHGDRRDHKARSFITQDRESPSEPVIRSRERINSPCHYGMVDRTDTAEDRT